MNRCARNGYLVNATYTLPSDPTDLDVEYLPTIGCSRIRCSACGAIVRNWSGLAFATKEDVPASTIAKLYELTDLSASPLIHPTQPAFRLYLCRCSCWLESSEHALAEPDRDLFTDPHLPWHCDGHPIIQLPHDLDGERIATRAELRAVADRGFRGDTPPRTRDPDRVRARWLVRLYVRLAPADASIVLAAAVAALEDADPRARSLALRFLERVPSEDARARLFDLLQQRGELFVDVPDDNVLFKADSTLEDTAWRVVAPLVARADAPRTAARVAAQSGRASRAIFDALAAHDSGWLVEHLDDIARAAPGRAGDLVDSLARLPTEARNPANETRIRSALLGDEEPLDAIRVACQSIANQVKQAVSTHGDMAPILFSLPALKSGARLELEMGALSSANDLRYLALRVDGKIVERLLERGHTMDLVLFLKERRTPERILYLARGQGA